MRNGFRHFFSLMASLSVSFVAIAENGGNGVYGGYVGSDLWLKGVRDSAYQQSLQRSLLRSTTLPRAGTKSKIAKKETKVAPVKNPEPETLVVTTQEPPTILNTSAVAIPPPEVTAPTAPIVTEPAAPNISAESTGPGNITHVSDSNFGTPTSGSTYVSPTSDTGYAPPSVGGGYVSPTTDGSYVFPSVGAGYVPPGG